MRPEAAAKGITKESDPQKAKRKLSKEWKKNETTEAAAKENVKESDERKQ